MPRKLHHITVDLMTVKFVTVFRVTCISYTGNKQRCSMQWKTELTHCRPIQLFSAHKSWHMTWTVHVEMRQTLLYNRPVFHSCFEHNVSEEIKISSGFQDSIVFRSNRVSTARWSCRLLISTRHASNDGVWSICVYSHAFGAFVDNKFIMGFETSEVWPP